MIVPFVFNLYNISNDVDFLWVFYKYADFCIKNGMPIIAQEEHFIDPKIYKEKNNHAVTSSYKYYDYKIYNKEELNKIINYKIKSDFKNKVIKEENYEKRWIELLSKEDDILIKEIEKAIDHIEKICKKKIKTILCWLTFPSLIKVCKQRGINLLNYEMTTVRYGTYNTSLGTMVKDTKYSCKEFSEKYKKFNHKNLLSRKELLTLLLNTNQLNIINKMDETPEFEFSIATGMENDVYELSHDNMSYEDVKSKLDKLVENKKVNIRTHPHKPINLEKFNYNIDKSENASEFILKSKRVICNLSNITYETMLYGRTLYVLSKDNLFYNESINSLDNIEDKIVDLKYLNFTTFAYYVPYSLMYDINYIRWREENQNINEIYEYNLKHIFKLHKIDYEKYFDLNINDRIKYLNKKIHKMENIVYEDSFDKFNLKKEKEKKLDELEKKYDDLKIELSNNKKEKNSLSLILTEKESLLQNNINAKLRLEEEIKSIYSSKSWKVTKPLRKVMQLISKKK